jgi:hypothetical protein
MKYPLQLIKQVKEFSYFQHELFPLTPNMLWLAVMGECLEEVEHSLQ